MTDQRCTVCNQPATMQVRDVQETLPTRTANGVLYKQYKPVGEAEYRCKVHGARQLPMSADDAERLKALEAQWADQDRQRADGVSTT